MTKKHIHWLHEQLPLLVAQGIITSETAASIKSHYDHQEAPSSRPLALTIFAILGGVLIAGGIILLMAHNWMEFNRSTRAFISFLLVILGQAVVGYALWKDKISAAYREGSGLFAQLTFGAGMALIGQTYHLSDDLGAFTLTWMLCTLPLVYLLRASGPALIYLAGVTFWACNVHGWYDRSHPAAWWIWIALLIPYAVMEMRRNPYHPRAILLMWGLGICLAIGTGICLESGWRNLWLVIYSGMFVSLYLIGSFWQGEGTSLWQRPLTFIGGLGATILLFIMTFDNVWNHIGWVTGSGNGQEGSWAALHDVFLACITTLTSVILMVTCRRRGQSFHLGLGILPVVVTLGYLLIGSGYGSSLAGPFFIIANLYFLGFSIMTLVEGIKERQLGTVNYGMLMMAALILTRFFDSDFGFIAKGLVFIVLGSAFLGVNFFLARRKGGPTP